MTSKFRLLFLLIAIFASQISFAQYKHIFIRCEDQYGILLMNDTISEPYDVCLLLQPPAILYYRCISHDEKGTNVCIKTDTHMTMVYATEAVMGFRALTQEPVENLRENMSLVLMSDEGLGRMVWSALPHRQQWTAISLSRGGHDALATWVLKSYGNEWAILNEATGLFLASLPTTSTLGKEGEGIGTLSTMPHLFSIQKTANGRWLLTDAETQQSQEVTLAHHDIRLYFTMLVQYNDEAGRSLLPDQMLLVPAGESFSPKAPMIEGYSWVNTFSMPASLEAIAENGWVEFVYQPTATNGIASPSSHRSLDNAVFDLSGRKVKHPARGIYIVKGQKVVMP